MKQSLGTPSTADGRSPEGALEFRLLGSFEVWRANRLLRIGGQRQMVVLALLLLNNSQVVSQERLIRAIWGEWPPKSARSQVHICVSRLRELLGADLIVTKASGYRMHISEETLDIGRFRRLIADGRESARQGEPITAVNLLREALELCRGDPLAGVESNLVRAAAMRLAEERVSAITECVGLEMALGRHRRLIGELREVSEANPMNEKLHGHLVLALYRDGRQAEALDAYRNYTGRLRDECGMEPGAEIRSLEKAILQQAPVLDLSIDEPAQVVPRPVVLPRQLPAAADLCGRDEVAKEMIRCLRQPAFSDSMRVAGVPVVLVNGTGGVGKTALALHVASRVREDFPDGQLFAQLRGADGASVSPKNILVGFLRALGVPSEEFPEDVDSLAALYRSRLAGCRVLVVLDDAADVAQVLPLIPGEATCAVVVTSRRGMRGLYAPHRFTLRVLESGTSVALLARMFGETWLEDHRDAAQELARWCGHLPLALKIVAEKLSVRGHQSIGEMTGRLRDKRLRLDELSLGDDGGVRQAVLSSIRELSIPAKRLVLLFAEFGQREMPSWAAGPLLEARPADASEALDELLDHSLVTLRDSTGGGPRYEISELTGLVAQESLGARFPADHRTAALRRLLRCWLALADRAQHAMRVRNREHRLLLSELSEGFRGRGDALPQEPAAQLMADPVAWYQRERENLTAMVSLAARCDQGELSRDLAAAQAGLAEAPRAFRDSGLELWRVRLG